MNTKLTADHQMREDVMVSQFVSYLDLVMAALRDSLLSAVNIMFYTRKHTIYLLTSLKGYGKVGVFILKVIHTYFHWTSVEGKL